MMKFVENITLFSMIVKNRSKNEKGPDIPYLLIK